jgi:hypothetical protein
MQTVSFLPANFLIVDYFYPLQSKIQQFLVQASFSSPHNGEKHRLQTTQHLVIQQLDSVIVSTGARLNVL